jgi:hypothetical protein
MRPCGISSSSGCDQGTGYIRQLTRDFGKPSILIDIATIAAPIGHLDSVIPNFKSTTLSTICAPHKPSSPSGTRRPPKDLHFPANRSKLNIWAHRKQREEP